MTTFFWSGGYLGWPFFGILLFSFSCLLVTDIVWRSTRLRARKILLAVAVFWVAGVALALVLYFR